MQPNNTQEVIIIKDNQVIMFTCNGCLLAVIEKEDDKKIE